MPFFLIFNTFKKSIKNNNLNDKIKNLCIKNKIMQNKITNHGQIGVIKVHKKISLSKYAYKQWRGVEKLK